MPTGFVYIVGAGPGDPALITVRGISCLRRAEVLLHDDLVHHSLLSEAPSGCEVIYVGKRASRHSMRQDEISSLMAEHALAGKVVVRLKGGDPFVFGRGAEEAQALAAAGVAFEIVPGVSAGTAVPACAGIPLTRRGRASSVAFVTGHEASDKGTGSPNWEKLAGAADTLVFFMGRGNLSNIVDQLISHGRSPDAPTALIEQGTLPAQKIAEETLENIVAAAERLNIGTPALLVVGEVVAFREQLAWFEKRPLFGKRIVITRSRSQAGSLRECLLELGADVLEVSAVRMEPVRDQEALERTVQLLPEYDWVIFASANGVDQFFDCLLRENVDVRALGSSRLAAIGNVTAERLRALCLRVDFVPSRYDSETFAGEFPARYPLQGRRVLFPGGEMSRDVIQGAVIQAGGRFDFLPLYRTVPDPDLANGIGRLFGESEPDWVTFASPSAARFFLHCPRPAARFRIASIGPATSTAVREAGHAVDAEAEIHTADGLIECILKYETRHQAG